MEKKNTMLLTVIAVATLLVAVVGATFAYFSLSMNGSSTTTTATVEAKTIGTATIATKQENLTLKLTPQEMSKEASSEGDKTYYAVAGNVDDSSDHSTSTPIEISDISYTGGEEGTTYKCPVQTEVSVSGDMYEHLREGWTQLILVGDAVNKSSGSAPGTTWTAESSELKVDLQQALSAGPQAPTKSVKFKGEVTVTGATMAATNILKASLSLTNKQDAEQNDIANSNLQVTVKVTPDGECKYQAD